MEAKLRSALRRRSTGHRTAGLEHLQEEPPASSPPPLMTQHYGTNLGCPRSQRDPEIPESHQLSISVCQSTQVRFLICLDNTVRA